MIITDCTAGEGLLQKTERAAGGKPLRRTERAAGEEPLRRTERAAGGEPFIKGCRQVGIQGEEKILWREERCNYYHRRFLTCMTETVGWFMMKEKAASQSISR